VIGAYNWRSDEVTYLNVERKNSDTFIEFLEEHLYSAKVQAALSLFEHRVQVFWLPQYCPELNVIERFWLHLKYTAWANKLYTTIDALRCNVARVLHQPNEPSYSERLTFANFFQ
jgi:transposase